MVIKLRNLKEVLIHLIRASKVGSPKRFSILLNGPTGMGKTATIEEISRELGMTLIDYRLSSMSPEDAGGIPYRKGDSFLRLLDERLEPIFTQPSILFLDEFNRANPFTQNSVMSVIFERHLGGRKLHPDTVVILAVNTGDEYSNVMEMDKALLARCAILNLVPSLSDDLQNHLKTHYPVASDIILQRWEELDKSDSNDIIELLPVKSLRSREFAAKILE